MKKLLYAQIILLSFILIKNSYGVAGVGSIVYDPTNASNMAAQAKQMAESIEHQKDMATSIGKGDFSPSVISYLDNMYSSCGGKKYGLPDWFPKFPIVQICTDENTLIEPVVTFYKENMLPLTSDTPAVATEKRKYQMDNASKVRGYALGKSQIVLDKSPTTSEKIINLQKAAKDSTSQIEVAKVQLQVNLAMLEEMQKMNESQALILQILGWKN